MSEQVFEVELSGQVLEDVLYKQLYVVLFNQFCVKSAPRGVLIR